MNSTATNTGSALDGELYVEMVPGYNVELHRVTFPALIDTQREGNLCARPRFRREVAESLAEWLNLVYPSDPDWYHLARFDGDTLLVIARDEDEPARQHHAVLPDDDGRYPLGHLYSWFLSTPTPIPAQQRREQVLLHDRARRIPTEGEILLSCDPDDRGTAAFPAQVDPSLVNGHPVPTFRREVAEVVIAWCNIRHHRDPDRYPQAYFDGDTLVHIHQHLRDLNGYTPWRIDPDQHGKYRVDGDEWIWRHLNAAGTATPDTAPLPL
jgi:hypothetical protein